MSADYFEDEHFSGGFNAKELARAILADDREGCDFRYRPQDVPP
jgi:hypothetical protein